MIWKNKIKESNHKIELLNLEHAREVDSLKSKLDKKNKEVSEEIEHFIMNQLDLDAYNITSDDFGSSKRSNLSDSCVDRSKAHPLVPKLDFKQIFEWRERSNNDNVIMIRISESRLEGEDNFDNKEIENFNESDIHDAEVKENIKIYYPKGSSIKTTSDRINSLLERKQMIIDALNMAYSEEEEEQ